MSSSLSPAATPAAALNTTLANINLLVGSGHRNAPAAAVGAGISASSAQFREIHKNTWLKRLSADGKKFTIGPKKSECSWVVFCVHDDTEALLEGYAEPRQAAVHMPEWVVSLRDTLHISHALIPNSHEFEFVVTLSNEVLRFHAVSWEIMQEWVETLRSKLREMKILSPRENLYTKLPEVRAPLLPTRDPTSPLPAPPPVPAAIVPGVERVVTVHQTQNSEQPPRPTATEPTATVLAPITTISNSNSGTTATPTPPPPAMSNTLTQHLLNMLSDPISTYSEQINETATPANETATDDETIAADSQHSTFDADVNLSDDEFLSPLLRKATMLSDNGVRVDVAAATAQRVSADQILCLEQITERLIPRPQTSRSMSAGAADKSKKSHKCIEAAAAATTTSNAAPVATITTATASASTAFEPQDNVTIIQVSNASSASNSNDLPKSSKDLPPKLPPKLNIVPDIFRFPEISAKAKTKQQRTQQHEYKSNVQIIPSNSSTIQVLGQSNTHTTQASSNPYTMPVKPNASSTVTSSTISNLNTTMVHVLGDELPSATATTVAVYGTCYPTDMPTTSGGAKPQTPKLSKKIILTANTSGITNISVNSNHTGDAIISGNVHYEKVFLSSSIPISSSSNIGTAAESPRRQPAANEEPASSNQSNTVLPADSSRKATQTSGTPVLPRRRIASPPAVQSTTTANASSARAMPQLTRGLTELVISTRPSRRDFHYLKLLNTPLKTKQQHKAPTVATNNNIESSGTSSTAASLPVASNRSNINVTTAESVEQRRRSSSTSDAQAPLQRGSTGVNSQRGANNNEFITARGGGAGASGFRIQQPPQSTPTVGNTAIVSPNKRMTLREQQVMQLRREIMHPGGVRLNLRRKDCVGSIAWVDAFGAVWIAGWKQKEHPVLYNALHIGDQLLSIAGVSISSATEANKIMRNTNTLFVEVLLRRMPFGRAYAIRRDREGQCLGLIRDGNTSTIVDIVPNSLAARHGLPPKAQSCDGSSLTFWMLTEINGRPLNLFFKELEIRDRLNSVGRDISVLVQPSDLITKLKKQLKSLRGYKDYLVQ